MPITQRPRTPTGEVERVHTGQVARTPTRPRPVTATTTRTQRRVEHLDRLLVAHRKVTEAIKVTGEPRARRRLTEAADSLSKAILLRFNQVTTTRNARSARSAELERDVAQLRRSN